MGVRCALLVGALTWPVLAEAGGSGAAAEKQAKPEREWVRHRIIPGDSWSSVSSRYGVSVKSLKRWNPKASQRSLVAYRTKLKVYATNPPPARVELPHVVRKGETWSKIAKVHGVDVALLKRWNRKVDRLIAGKTITVWTEPQPPAPPPDTSALPIPDLGITVPGGGYSVGKPNGGRLINGVQMPATKYWMVFRPHQAFGTSHTIGVMVNALALWRRDAQYGGLLVIGAISKQGGGHLKPHRSHQSGRDVDVNLPKLVGVPPGKRPTADEVDWNASWILVRSLIASGQVEYVFLSYSRQGRMYRAAKANGATKDELEKWFQYPRGSKAKGALVRHASGHETHFHVRIKCAPGNEQCVTY